MIDRLLSPIRTLVWHLWCRWTWHKFMPIQLDRFSKPGPRLQEFTMRRCAACDRYLFPAEVQHALNMIEAELDRMEGNGTR